MFALALVATVDRYQHPESKLEDIRTAAKVVSSKAHPGDAIAFMPSWARLGFPHHLDRERHPSLADLDIRRPGKPPADDSVFTEEASAHTVAKRMDERRRIWVVGYPNNNWDILPIPWAG